MQLLLIKIRKLYDEKDIAKGKQRVTTGNAVWYMNKKLMVLTKDPILYRGLSKLKGNIIKMDLYLQTMKVSDGTIVLREKTEY